MDNALTKFNNVQVIKCQKLKNKVMDIYVPEPENEIMCCLKIIPIPR